jgi:uncharacterized paraquat-inducible protein A
MHVLDIVAKWTLIALFVIGAILTIAKTGQPRKAITPGDAATIAIIDAVIILAIVTFWNT